MELLFTVLELNKESVLQKTPISLIRSFLSILTWMEALLVVILVASPVETAICTG